MTNERLRSAMATAHVDIEVITRAAGVDPKTVQRWLKGRIPHARHRWKVAELLNVREDILWPDVDNDAVSTPAQSPSEVVAAYAHRTDVPFDMWWKFFLQTQEQIDLLGGALQFLPEQHPNLVNLLQRKAMATCKIRIAIADPLSRHVRMRDAEEQLGGTLPAQIQTTLYHFRSIRNSDSIEIRHYNTIMYNSIFRFDDDMFVIPHLYGLHSSQSPLLHLRNLGENGIFASFARHFEAVWATTALLF